MYPRERLCNDQRWEHLPRPYETRDVMMCQISLSAMCHLIELRAANESARHSRVSEQSNDGNKQTTTR